MRPNRLAWRARIRPVTLSRVISAQAAAASGAQTGRAGNFGGFRTRWALLISVAGGLALYASFPPTDAWPLAVLGPALLVLALTGRSLRGSFGCALAFGLAQFVPLLSWLINLAWYAWAGLAGCPQPAARVVIAGERGSGDEQRRNEHQGQK